MFFFFQAEDGIRDRTVTGVQTCALPIYLDERVHADERRRAPLPSLLERDEREDQERGHEGVALAVLHREQHLEVHERQGDRRRPLGEESVERVPQEQRVEQAPAQERERARQVGERREQQREGRAVLVEVEVLLRVRGV